MSELTERLRSWGCDVAGALERMVDDEELYQDCMQMFVADENFAELGQAVEQDAYQNAFENAHALKGVSGNLGLLPLQEPVSELTELLRLQLKESAECQQAQRAELHKKMTALYAEILRRKAEFEALVRG